MRTAAALAAVFVVAASCGGARNAAPSSASPALPSPAATATSSAAAVTGTPAVVPGRPVEDVIAEIDEARLVAHMNALAGFGSRDPRHPGHKQAAQYLKDQLVRQLPAIPIGVHQLVYQGIPLENIIVTISPTAPGAQTSVNGAILICAHYDSTASRTPGWRPALDPAPGADDNATGTAALLEMARILAGERASLRRPVVLAFFDGEELFFKGSAAYAQTLQNVAPPVKFGGVIDIDMVGFNPTADRLDLIWYTNGSAGLRDRVAAANDRYKIGVSPLNPQLATDASTILDAAAFGLTGTPAIALVERYGDPDATYPGNPAFHTTQDTPDRVTNHRLWLKAAKLALATALDIARSG